MSGGEFMARAAIRSGRIEPRREFMARVTTAVVGLGLCRAIAAAQAEADRSDFEKRRKSE